MPHPEYKSHRDCHAISNHWHYLLCSMNIHIASRCLFYNCYYLTAIFLFLTRTSQALFLPFILYFCPFALWQREWLGLEVCWIRMIPTPPPYPHPPSGKQSYLLPLLLPVQNLQRLFLPQCSASTIKTVRPSLVVLFPISLVFVSVAAFRRSIRWQPMLLMDTVMSTTTNTISRFRRRLLTRSCSFITIGLSAVALKWA